MRSATLNSTYGKRTSAPVREGWARPSFPSRARSRCWHSHRCFFTEDDLRSAGDVEAVEVHHRVPGGDLSGAIARPKASEPLADRETRDRPTLVHLHSHSHCQIVLHLPTGRQAPGRNYENENENENAAPMAYYLHPLSKRQRTGGTLRAERWAWFTRKAHLTRSRSPKYWSRCNNADSQATFSCDNSPLRISQLTKWNDAPSVERSRDWGSLRARLLSGCQATGSGSSP